MEIFAKSFKVCFFFFYFSSNLFFLTKNVFLSDDKGIALIGVFGAIRSHESDGTRAVKTALSFSHRLEEIGVVGGIGVTFGPAYVGFVGCETRKEFAFLGTVVNLAARLAIQACQRKPPVLCDQKILNATMEFAEIQPVTPLILKGLGRTTAYLLQNIKTSPDLHSKRKMVGRDEEVSIVEKELNNFVFKGKCGALFIEGENSN